MNLIKRIFNFKPSRGAADGRALKGYVTDIDAIKELPTYILFNGKYWKIKPITNIEFFMFSDCVGRSIELQKKQDVTWDELVNFYEDLFTPLIDGFGRKEVEALVLDVAQLNAVINTILDTVTGKLSAEKKKMMATLAREKQATK